MVATIWTYRVKATKTAEFERAYAADGDWAKLFSRAPGYQGTTFLKDPKQQGRYATVDRWESLAAWDSFKQQFAREYEELDRICGELTDSEEHVGVFEKV